MHHGLHCSALQCEHGVWMGAVVVYMLVVALRHSNGCNTLLSWHVDKTVSVLLRLQPLDFVCQVPRVWCCIACS